MNNKYLLEKYPFLVLKNSWSGEVIKQENPDNPYIEFKNDIPEGWWKRFGILLLDDMKDIMDKNNIKYENFMFTQVKEKYGRICIYHNGMPEEWFSHEYAWEYISEHTCIKCGEFPVKMRDDGWFSPWCDKCLREKYNDLDDNTYSEYLKKWTIDNDDRLQEYVVIDHHNKDGEYQEWIDMKPYYDKIGWKYTREDLIDKKEFESLIRNETD